MPKKQKIDESDIPVQEAPMQSEPQHEPVPETSELQAVKDQLAAEHDNYLRLAAEYDNFRKRSQKERDTLYADVRAETAEKFLSVFDNLDRAIAQETTDESYKRGVEMILTGFLEVMEKLGIHCYGEIGEPFDPTYHDAIMHTADDSFGDNTIVEVFQKGFRLGEKVVRFATVKVAN